MKKNLTTQNVSPGKLSMIPMFYIAWSDGVLSPSEMKLIHKKIEQFDFLTEDDKKYLIRWSDPKNPPNDEVFREWSHIIKSESISLSKEQRKSLAEIGLELARSSTQYRNEEIWNAPKTLKALEDIERDMSINPGSLRSLTGSIRDVSESTIPSKESFDPKSLCAFLDGSQKETKDRMRKLLRDPLFKYQEIPNKDEFRKHTLKLMKALAKQGIGAYAFPTEYGGGGKVGRHITVFEMLSYYDLSLTIKFGVQFGLFGGAVYGLGTEKHYKKYIPQLSTAELLGCFAMTETGHGSNVKGLETQAVYNIEDDSLTIHSPSEAAGKEYIGNALHAEMAAVFAQLIVNEENHGVHCIMVPIRDKQGNLMPGIRVEDCGYKMGLNGIDNGRIWFDHVNVPKDNLLNKYGDINSEGQYVSSIDSANRRFFTMLGALIAGRVCVGTAGVNASKSALTIAMKYAMKRRQFAPKDGEQEMLIMDYPTHQRRLIPLLAKTYAYHFSLADLADDFIKCDSEEERRQIETDAAGLKAMATWHCTETVQECREACGGKGYLSENRFADLKADTDIFTTFEGDNTVLMQLVAKGILTEFKHSFHEEGFRAVMRYLVKRIGNRISENNPYSSRNTSLDHLLDLDFYREALRYRRDKLLITLSTRMQDYLKKRLTPHEAFLRCQVHMVALAKAYVEYKTLKSFYKAIERNTNPSEKKILQKIHSLYALTVIESDKGWFLENDYMEGSKTKAIRRVINKLCRELRPELNGLLDAFGIPEELLGAKIIL